MPAYTELWREIDSRLNAAWRHMCADAPNSAARIQAVLREWLDHNELKLALDELLGEAEEAEQIPLRRFWEELLTAAMLMGLKRQFLQIASRIPDLEPHVFGTEYQPMRVSCDFNGFIKPNVFSLNAVGTALDFARLSVLPVLGQRLVLYDTDAENDGTPTWLIADAQIIELESWGLVARTDPKSFRWEPRRNG